MSYYVKAHRLTWFQSKVSPFDLFPQKNVTAQGYFQSKQAGADEQALELICLLPLVALQ